MVFIFAKWLGGWYGWMVYGRRRGGAAMPIEERTEEGGRQEAEEDVSHKGTKGEAAEDRDPP